MRRFWRKCYMNATVEGPRSQPLRALWSTGHTLNHSELQHGRGQSSHSSRIAFERRIFWRAMRSGFIGIVEDVMRLQLRCHSDIEHSQPGMQVEIRSRRSAARRLA